MEALAEQHSYWVQLPTFVHYLEHFTENPKHDPSSLDLYFVHLWVFNIGIGGALFLS